MPMAAIPLVFGGSALFGTVAGASTAAIITDVALAGLSTAALGQYQAGQAAEAQGESQAVWNEYNAQLAERDAKEAQEAAAHEERRFRKGGQRLKATQRARFAKAGVTPEGSPDIFEEQQITEIEEDALNIRRGGVQAGQRFTAEAGLQRLAGKSALLRGTASRRASRYNVAATGLKGAAGLGYQYGTITGRFP